VGGDALTDRAEPEAGEPASAAVPEDEQACVAAEFEQALGGVADQGVGRDVHSGGDVPGVADRRGGQGGRRRPDPLDVRAAVRLPGFAGIPLENVHDAQR
jgi:hypothetical protein